MYNKKGITMKTLKIKKTLLMALLVAGTVLLSSANSVFAAQIDYNDPNNQPIQNARFNAYTNVPGGIGDEADFVELRTSSGDPTVPATQNNFIDPVNAACNVGEKFDIRTYIHNSANTEFNDNGNGTAVAKNVNVAMTAPFGTAGKSFTFRSVISASNADSVTDTGKLNCTNNVQLKLVPQTVKVYTKALGWTNGPDSAVNGNLAIGSRVAGSGTQWGCWDDRVIVVYVVEVVAVPATPVYACDALDVTRIGDLKKERKYSYTVRYTAKNGATIKSVRYNFGDDKNQTLTATPFTAEHTYAKDGKYKVTTDLVFTVSGQEKTVTDAKCTSVIDTSVEQPPVVPPVTPPVTTIPSTGVGGIVVGLLGSSAAGYGAYAYFESKRTLKNLIGRK